MSTNKQPIIVGLDIGTTKIVAIAGRKNEYGKLEILGFGKSESAGVSHGVVLNIDQCIRAIEQALDRCRQSNPNLEINDVYVGIAGQHIKSMQTRGDIVRKNADDIITQNDIDRLINDQNKTFIPASDSIIDVIPQDFIVDNTNNISNPIGMSGVKIGANFHIITGDRNAIRNIDRCVTSAHLNRLELILQPLASAAAIINDQDLEAGVAIIDIGGGTTDMAVFHDGILRHTAVIPYAGTNITEDIRQGLGVLKAQAEALKVQFGVAIPSMASENEFIAVPGLRGMDKKDISVKNLSSIIHARMEEIFDFVLYHLKQLNLDKKLHGGIILTGGGSRLKNIVQLCEYVTGVKTRLGFPNEHLAGSSNDDSYANPMYSTCIGLILKGYMDFERGRLRDADNGNSQHSIDEVTTVETDDVFIKVVLEDEQGHIEDLEEDNTGLDAAAIEARKKEEEEKKRKEKERKALERANKSKKRNEAIYKVFNQIKVGFMKLFEDPDDIKM